MDSASALTQLETMVDADADPVVSSDELSAILARARRPDRAGNPITNVAADVAAWQASTRYKVGDVITPDPPDGRYWMCVTPGVTNTYEPTWPEMKWLAPFVSTVLDDFVVWVYAGTEYDPTWDLNAAAAEGWRIKAGKVAGRYNFTTDGQQFARAQMLAHCRQMEKMYRRKITGGL